MAESSRRGHRRVPSASPANALDRSKQGTFMIEVAEARNILDSNEAGSRIYCSCQFEKQEIRTAAVQYSQTPQWKETFRLDTTNTLCEVFFTVWEALLDGNRRFLGRLIIRVNLSMIENCDPIVHWYTLRERYENEEVSGEILLKLSYSVNKRNVGSEDFENLCVLGRGGFGKVMLVRKVDTSRIYAMKSLHKDKLIESDEVEGTKTEKDVLRRLNHPFIVGLKFSFQTKDKLYLILDYINGGELFYHLKKEKRFSESRARFYAAEITLALEYLHKSDIIYRDIKPENILLDSSGHICLTDFGLCKPGVGYGKVTYTFCGTAEYLAPEVLEGKGYDKAVDWWSLGTLLYEMLCGKPPFFSTNTNEMYRRILHEKLIFPAYVPPVAVSLLSGLLNRNPRERLGSSLNDAEDIKSHPFFQPIDWAELYNKEIEPEFKPPVRDPLDTSNFDPNFTSQRVEDSPVRWQLAPSQQNQFVGFSYTNPNEFPSSVDSK
eukprot:TRINITY_DN5132_c0_g1_i1.p1 TRINITY_DN5132_c0_g1~~TRINITY_DN5132_c0_g1_i1.p1  ORF type:complete len:491 (-),score=99.28 TRINITY_DN5132_c0_g1_i1:256-1728(-)